ncbi:MAG: NINE protein [Oscillospiraceae bacterium]
MNDSNRVSLVKPGGTSSDSASQGWRDPATGEIYPNSPAPSVQQGSYAADNNQTGYVPGYGQNGSVQQPMNNGWQNGGTVQQGYPQQNTPYQQYQAAPQTYQPDAVPQPYQQPYQPVQQAPVNGPTKFCKHCGQIIPADAVLCTHCGRQVEELKGASQTSQPIIINNNNNNNVAAAATSSAVPTGKEKNKWVALLLCFFFGYLGIHRFYEGKIGTGILWMCTAGLFGVGTFIDFIILLFKHNPYYV